MTNAEKCKRWRNRNPATVDAKSLARMKKERADERFMRRARLAKRDLDYAGSPCAARVTVDCVRTTDGRTLVVETRGRAVVGCRASGCIHHT